MEGKKKEKKDFYLVESDSDIQKKERKKSSQTPNHVSFSPISLFLQVAFVLPYVLHLFHYFFLFYIIIYTIFTIYDTFYKILSLNNGRNTTNFTTYFLQIGMSPIKKNNFKHLFIIFFK